MTAPRILIDKKDLRALTLEEAASTPLEPGQARLKLDLFSLTANNVTYAAVGEQFLYWQFFPAPDGKGLAPVWGFGVVSESRVEGLAVGERLWGYYPFGSELVVTPTRLTEFGFSDGVAHRAALPPVYNSYERVTQDPQWRPADEAVLALFRPLFTTSFLIDDFAAEQAFFGAKRVAFAAASSKTALGAARLMKARGGVEVVALTSAKNGAFCVRTGCYDRVVTYDSLDELPADQPVALIDMAGDAKLIDGLADRLGDQFVYNCMVGAAHWEETSRETKGPARSLFFAPDRIVQRNKDWGKAGYGQRYAAAWADFKASLDWLTIVDVQGAPSIAQAWLRLVEGRVGPQEGLICRF